LNHFFLRHSWLLLPYEFALSGIVRSMLARAVSRNAAAP
jgi:hypothetical protein